LARAFQLTEALAAAGGRLGRCTAAHGVGAGGDGVAGPLDEDQLQGRLGDGEVGVPGPAEQVCSCELEEPLGKSQPTISHHTKVLAEAGLIVGEKRGRWVWWRVVPDALDPVRQVLASTPG
jgi:DNA-binding transcriptional ArsR family regulator